MRSTDRRSVTAPLCALALASMSLGFATGCGGGGGGGSSTAQEPNQEYECIAVLSDPNQPTDSVDFPTPASPAPLACLPPGASQTDITAKCQSKCDGSRDQYATFIDQQDNLTGPSNEIISNDLTCQIKQTVLETTSSSATGCPNLDPPGQPEPLFAGGPAQYVASLSGQLSLAVDTGSILGTVNFNGLSIFGTIAYSIAPIDLQCPATGCQLLITSLSMQAPSFTVSESAPILGTLFSASVANLSIQNIGWIAGTWFPNGQFVIPANTARAVINLINNGTPASFDQTSPSTITGTINPATGAVSFDPVTESISDTTATVSPLSGSNVSVPPRAVITAPSKVECSQPNAAIVTLDGTASTDALGGPLHFYSWQVNGGPPLGGPTVQATVNLGTNSVLFNVYNSTLAVGVAQQTITVVDTTRPTFATLPATLEQAVCDSSTQPVVIPIPKATDICSPSVGVVGQIVSKNGVALSPPIAVGSGTLSLPPGVYQIQWTATDGSGNTNQTTQTLTIRPGIEANGFVSIDDSATVLLPNGSAAAIGNSGTGLVTIGVTAETGNIVTDGAVFLRSRSIVAGTIQAAGSVTTQPPVTVSGTVTMGSPVSLPPGLNLANVVFPSPLGAPVDLEPNVSRPLAPGAYSAVTVKAGATLTLSTGTYFIGNLDFESNSHVNLNQAAGGIDVFVQSSIIDRGQIATVSGSASGFVLGYAGTSTFFIQSPFPGGTVISPNAEVVIAPLGANAYQGQLFAQSIEVQSGDKVVCNAAITTAQHGTLFAWAPLGDRASPELESPASADAGACSVSIAGYRRGGLTAVFGLLAIALAFWRRSANAEPGRILIEGARAQGLSDNTRYWISGVSIGLAACGGSTASPSAPMFSCANAPIATTSPPLHFSDAFTVDTGLAPYTAVGSGYGEPTCPHQFLIDVDLTGALANKELFVFGGWSTSLPPPSACGTLAATTVIFARTAGSATFETWDTITSQGAGDAGDAGTCNASTTQTLAANQGAGGATVPAGMFAELRMATSATQAGAPVAVLVTGVVP